MIIQNIQVGEFELIIRSARYESGKLAYGYGIYLDEDRILGLAFGLIDSLPLLRKNGTWRASKLKVDGNYVTYDGEIIKQLNLKQ